MAVEPSLAEKRLLRALPADGSWVGRDAVHRPAGLSAASQVDGVADGPVRAGLVEMRVESRDAFSWSEEGEAYRSTRLPERELVNLLAKSGGRLPVPDAEARLGPAKSRIALAWAMRRKWTRMEEAGGVRTVVLAAGEPPLAEDERLLASLPPGAIEPPPAGPAFKALLERKGLIEAAKLRHVLLRLTPAGQRVAAALDPAAIAGAEEVSQVTPELVARWPTLSPAERARVHLRPFDFGVPVAPRHPGKPHPLQQIIEEVRGIFVALGFQEIAGGFVEPAFWNMDALFIPQDHPAREMQDTFYLKEPDRLPVPPALWRTVRDTQATGGKTGSTGWGGPFTEEESRRALLRTHTTVTTIRHLAAHPQPPAKVFGVGRVFRNEAMDATHLPEFHQIEGIVVEEGATFGTLIGLLREFYTRLGFPEVKFRPSYYPYTEPSLDVAVRWGDRWLELGGAGVFRPEVTGPLGVPCNVLAWGLGLERLAMMRLGLKDIRQLYLSDVRWLRENPLG